jgi:peroxiredoxin
MKTVITIMTVLLFLSCFAPVPGYSAQLGTMAPAFSLVDVYGRGLSLEQFKGKVVFLDFWAPWCIPCRQELPELDNLYKKFKKDGLEVIGISVDPSEKNTAAFLQKVPVGIHTVIDKKNEVSDAYGVTSLPTGFIIGKDGIVRYQHQGFDKAFLSLYEKEITVLLKQQ